MVEKFVRAGLSLAMGGATFIGANFSHPETTSVVHAQGETGARGFTMSDPRCRFLGPEDGYVPVFTIRYDDGGTLILRLPPEREISADFLYDRTDKYYGPSKAKQLNLDAFESRDYSDLTCQQNAFLAPDA